MQDKQIIKLYFTSPLHLSRGKANLEESFQTLHSDTLKSAIFYNALQLFGEAEIIGRQNEAEDDATNTSFFDAFSISSGFPFYGEELYFPKPLIPLPNLLDENKKVMDAVQQRKAKKKIAFLDKAHFEGLLQGTLSTISVQDLYLKKKFLAKNSAAFFDSKKDPNHPPTESPFILSEVIQKVAVPRTFAEETATFYMDRIYFKEGAGLFFFVEYHENVRPDIEKKVRAALQLLGDNGIGSDRSSGNGHFVPKSKNVTFNLPTQGTQQLNLSLYCPTRSEMKGLITDKTAYTLVKRGGFIASPKHTEHLSYRKKSVFMFKEGSVFPANDLQGKIVNLRPKVENVQEETVVSHDIWRDGRAIFLPINA
ncbi:MAG: type III-A CRISPR-associated RAMP protein Csm4 [Bacteroidota bacterium]